jgi:Bacterial RNA polymerase, alpha chain C terminal domain
MNDIVSLHACLVSVPTDSPAAATLEELPQRVRDIATLRGLGYSFREISEQFEVTPQAISLMLSRHRRVLKTLRGAVELAGLSPRAVNALGRHGIRSRAAAIEADVLELLKGGRNCGEKTLEEIRQWLRDDSCSGQSVLAGLAAC